MFVKLSDNLVSARVVKVDRPLCIVQFGSWINRCDSEGANCSVLDFLKEVCLLTSDYSHTIDLVH